MPTGNCVTDANLDCLGKKSAAGRQQKNFETILIKSIWRRSLKRWQKSCTFYPNLIRLYTFLKTL